MSRTLESRELLGKAPPAYAIDGVGGSGKSHAIEALQQQLMAEGISSTVFKVSGLGDYPAIRMLKQINAQREQLARAGEVTEKMAADKQKDRLFRIASRYQIKQFEAALPTITQRTVLLDRTPMLHWVYAASLDPNNPYLKEMYEEGKELVSRMNISRIFLLNVAPSTAFARMIARGVALEPSVQSKIDKIEELSNFVGAPQKEISVIKDKTFALLEQNTLVPKALSTWDFIPYRVMQGECERYQIALADVQQTIGIPFTLIDAEQPVTRVVGTIRAGMQ